MTELTLAAVCMNSQSNKSRNIEAALRLVRDAAKAGADWVLLPEIFHFFGPYKDLYDQAEAEGTPLLQQLSSLAKELKIVLFAGTIGERPQETVLNDQGERRVYNTMYVFGRDGALLTKYRKTHLFNLRAPDGKKLYCEEDGFLFGAQPVVATIDGFRVGLSICYDIRFGEYYQRLARDGALDVIVCPAAFTLKTGMDHWELLLRARAVEQQAFVFAANQYGVHAPEKESYGHSMVIDPWGTVLADTGATEGIAVARMSRRRIEEVRARLPALQNRRPDVYKS